jgi:peptide deformylase
MIRPVLRMGDPRLLRVAAPVTEFGTAQLAALLADLRDTMAHLGGVGIAAPQIGVGLRVVIFGFEHSERYPQAAAVPFTVLVNPVIEPLGEAREGGWEGCLSVPGLRGWVPRYRQIRYSGFDQRGTPLLREASDFHARVVQHECDHLDGILYPMRVEDMTRFGFTDVLFPDGLAAGED